MNLEQVSRLVVSFDQPHMDLFVDFQGFKDPSNTFIVKEFAIATSDGMLLQHWLVRSPYPISTLDSKTIRQCNWTTKYHHGVHWTDGDITIQSLHRQLQPLLLNAVIYVKGLEKANYLKETFRPSQVYELSNYPSLKDLETSNVYCIFHRKNTNKMCALNNVLKLVQYHNQ
uniref:Uncharacterized protein n=2 Tax=Graphocephala atropunctata TaxID=36148 RepID=A0A1B6KKM6_9HEMI